VLSDRSEGISVAAAVTARHQGARSPAGMLLPRRDWL
jgi:hypothetical protein